MTDPHDQLAALYTLATKWPGGIGECPWWVGQVRYHGGSKYGYYIDEDFDRVFITIQHALDLVTAEAERWLEGRGFWLFTKDGRCYMGPGVAFDSLPDALKHAKEQA